MLFRKSLSLVIGSPWGMNVCSSVSSYCVILPAGGVVLRRLNSLVSSDTAPGVKVKRDWGGVTSSFGIKYEWIEEMSLVSFSTHFLSLPRL